MLYKELVGTTIVRRGKIGVLTIGCQGGKSSRFARMKITF